MATAVEYEVMADMQQAPTGEALVVQTGDALTAEIHALEVVDDATFQRAAELSRRLAGWLKSAHSFFDPVVEAAHRSWKLANERRKSVIEPRELLKATLARAMGEYEAEQERKRQAAEAERQREQERLEAEAARLAAAATATLQEQEQERILAQAIDAEARGDLEAVSEILAQPIETPVVMPPPVFVAPVAITAPKAEGISFATLWSAELVSLETLVKAAASGDKNAMACLAFNQVKANALARALRDGLAIPGVRSVSKRSTATRA